MRIRKEKGYAEMALEDVHLDHFEFSSFLESVRNNGGSVTLGPPGSPIIVDVPLSKKGRTKRMYITSGTDFVELRYHAEAAVEKRVVFRPYREAVETVKDMIREGPRPPMRAEGTDYDRSSMPLMMKE